MRNSVYLIAQVALLVLLVSSSLTVVWSLYSSTRNESLSSAGGATRPDEFNDNNNNKTSKGVMKEELGMELYPTGSTLPDCSHACGYCFPCKRVMVSFKCLMAESCPVVYRCTCKGRYYQVPSS
ncbi:hypothetical protein Scep_001735 [Stephania cephalantha]|uniref:Epidermal patterning factor-like protein n=1 Tax=Stephania cephalantha TaxID=152367 RepID=A0AAP0LCK6_9MAGN